MAAPLTFRRAVLFTGLPARQVSAQEAAASAYLGAPVRVVAIPRALARIHPPPLAPDDVVLWDTTWNSHKLFEVVRAAAKAAGARMVIRRLTPGRLASELAAAGLPENSLR